LLALYPIVRTIVDWVQVYRVIATPRVDASVRSYDWIEWEDDEGIIYARYVFPSGPASEAGVQRGDIFYLLDYQQYFTGADLRMAIEGVPPGTTVQYAAVRGDDNIDLRVSLTRYPTFLYPLSATLWRFSLWGFALAAFFHVLGLVVAVPLAVRSVEARYSLVLIGVSALWIFGNLARILSIEFLGPPAAGSTFDRVFHLVAVMSLVGWIAFPALLVRKVLSGAFPALIRSALHTVLYLPVIVLTLIAATAVVRESIGPFTLDHLVAPILFYASCYIALASAFILMSGRSTTGANEQNESENWNRRGSQITLAVSVLAALTILGIVPVLTDPGQERAGWFVVFAQLLSTAPVILVSIATLRFGRMDAVIRRALSYTLTGGGLFFLLVVLLGLIDARIPGSTTTRNVIAAFSAVLIVFVVERLVRLAAPYIASVFPSERQRAALLLGQFQDNVRDIVEVPQLVRESVDLVGEAFEARSAVLFVQSPTSPGQWIAGSYHPEPPYVTESFLRQIWPHLARDRTVWAYNAALNRSRIPAEVSRSLAERGAALAQPIVGREGPVGLVVLGRKKERGAVYNLGDVDRLQWLSGQLALAIERVKLIERHNLLARETAQAQLVALRSQINPHFLFNALNTIMALIQEKPADAERTLDHLASIFRTILQAGDKEFVTLDEELDLVRAYLAIEQVRFGDKLTIRESVPDNARSFPVPAFAIQTLVENAVKHGIEKKIDGGRVSIDVTRPEAELLTVRVSDTGVGIPSLFVGDGQDVDDRAYFGIGLTNVVLRTEQLYGRTDLFHVSSAPGGGTIVELRLPASRAEQHDEREFDDKTGQRP
jgi:GAF domain-containing protein